MDAVGIVMQATPLPVELQSFFESLTTTEGRLAVSVAIVFVTLLLAGLAAPAVGRRLTQFLHGLIPDGRASLLAERMDHFVPTTIAEIFLRAIQIGLFLLAVVSLLVVWGLMELAVEVLTLLGLSIPLLAQIATTLVLGVVAYGASDILREAIDRFVEGSERVTEHQREIIFRAGNLGIIALFVSAVLTVWGVDLSGLLVGAGFLGIVVGLAARQTLGSIIAGFVLMFSRPFTIGDWIEVGDNEGIVTEITIMNTRMENFDGETVVIPNDRVNNQPITNRSERGHYRIRLDVGIDYDSDPEHAGDVAQETLEDIDVITDSPPPRVVPKSFGDSAVVLELRFWIDRPMPPRKWRAIEAAVTSIKDAFETENIKIPYPQRELSGRAETGGFRIAGEQSGSGRAGGGDMSADG
jgi:small-conductance mechanosensitive channel